MLLFPVYEFPMEREIGTFFGDLGSLAWKKMDSTGGIITVNFQRTLDILKHDFWTMPKEGPVYD